MVYNYNIENALPLILIAICAIRRRCYDISDGTYSINFQLKHKIVPYAVYFPLFFYANLAVLTQKVNIKKTENSIISLKLRMINCMYQFITGRYQYTISSTLRGRV